MIRGGQTTATLNLPPPLLPAPTNAAFPFPRVALYLKTHTV